MSEMFQIQKEVSRAYVMINCHDGSEETALEFLHSISGIKQIEHTIGIHDILVEIKTDTIEKLRDIIEFQIRKMPMVRSTTTLICGQSSEDGEYEW